MPIVGKAADSESPRSLKSPLLATDACPDSELEIEQSSGATLPTPQAGRQLREGCQRPVELSTTERDILEICIQNEEPKIRQHLGVDSTLCPSSVSIFRVPRFLKVSRKREAYVPKIVSLGPYHHGDEKLKSMEIHKVRAVSRMMMRINNMDFFRSAVVKILEDKDEIMNNYEEKYDSNPENLVMMVRDGCFILEIMRTLVQPPSTPTASVSNFYEPIFEIDKIDYTGFDMVNDMLKLENQIPLVVLIKLLELESKFHNVLIKLPELKLLELLHKVLLSYPISKFYPFPLYEKKELALDEKKELSGFYPSPLGENKGLSGQLQSYGHLLGVLHSLIVFRKPDKKKEQQVDSKDKVYERFPIPCAVKLKNAGIKFEKLNTGVIQEIKYEKSTIHLPPITITDHTEVLFRNLVALELCKRFETNYVICYVTLMDELINSGEDVGVLTRNKILTHHLGSDEEVAKLFNGLCTGVTLSRNDLVAFQQLRKGVYDDYNNKTKVHFAEFVNEKFSSPWKALALLGAVIGLVLTLVTTIFSVAQYYK